MVDLSPFRYDLGQCDCGDLTVDRSIDSSLGKTKRRKVCFFFYDVISIFRRFSF